MSYEYGWPPYVTVAERRRKAASHYHRKEGERDAWARRIAILLESPLFFRVNLLRCLRIIETLLGGLIIRGEVSQMWVRQLRRTRPMQEM